MIIQPVFHISEWTNNLQSFFSVDTKDLDPKKIYKMLAGTAYEKLIPGEELIYSEEINFYDTKNKKLNVSNDEILFFKIKVEKVFSFGNIWNYHPYDYSDHLICEINNDRLKNLVLCRIINDTE